MTDAPGLISSGYSDTQVGVGFLSIMPINGYVQRLMAMMTIALVACSFTLLLPGFIAFRGHVFYDDEVVNKLPNDVAQSLVRYQSARAALRHRESQLTDRLNKAKNTDTQGSSEIYHELLHTEQEVNALQPPIRTLGFYLNPQMLLWPAIYTSLAWLIFCTKPAGAPSIRRLNSKAAIVLAAIIYIYYEWPLWVRNFVLGNHGRTVYAYPNIDIHVPSFVMQELTIFGFCSLVGVVWLQWSSYSQTIEAELSNGTTYFDEKLSARLQREEYGWFLSSAILGLGFLYFTTFFWSLVAKYHDQRYILSAALAHSLWVFTWVAISLPLYKVWSCSRQRRNAALAELINDSATSHESEDARISLFEKLETLSGLKISFAGIGAAASFIFPLIQLFLKH